VFDPPDDDKTRDKHVEPKRGVLSDAGSIPAASTNFLVSFLLVGRRGGPRCHGIVMPIEQVEGTSSYARPTSAGP
jgi:hypothetical protein